MQGTSSDAGKSTIVAGLGRLLRRRGLRVRPSDFAGVEHFLYGNLSVDEVVRFLRSRPSGLHVIVTGRNAKPELISIADLVTEMTLVKHPFRDQNVRAQKGVEF